MRSSCRAPSGCGGCLSRGRSRAWLAEAFSIVEKTRWLAIRFSRRFLISSRRCRTATPGDTTETSFSRCRMAFLIRVDCRLGERRALCHVVVVERLDGGETVESTCCYGTGRRGSRCVSSAELYSGIRLEDGLAVDDHIVLCRCQAERCGEQSECQYQNVS